MNPTSKSKLEWHKVTPLSKLIAMIIFIILPFIGFILGMHYQTLVLAPYVNESYISNYLPRLSSASIGGLANPATKYCLEKGGVSKIITAADGSQSGRCTLKTGQTCDEWDFLKTKACK